MSVERSRNSGEATAERQPNSSRAFQEQCLEAAERFAERYLSIMDLLGEELYQMADQADEHEMRRLYFSSLQTLYSRRSELKGEFKKEFLASIKAELQQHADPRTAKLFAHAAISSVSRLPESASENTTGHTDQSPPASNESEQNHDPFTHMAQTLPKGSWVQFRQPDGESYKARFTWINQNSGVYLFVDRNGRKAPDRTPAELANALRAGSATIIHSAAQLARAANDRNDE